ncbi:MAG: hypothetical protein QNL04_01855 [SAR324 cluster bacterium]|nr:hypothetical protein [SAR324 cluster bacterium]
MIQGRILPFFRFFVSLAVALLFSNSAQAKLPSPDDLIGKILEAYAAGNNFSLTLEVSVYDPEAYSPIDQETAPAPPFEISANAYVQQIVFVRDDFVAIESYSKKKQLLHLLMKKGSLKLEQSLNKKRTFTEEDATHPALFFYTRLDWKLIRDLNELGLAPLEVKLKEVEEEVYFQLGFGDEYLLVDPVTFRVVELNRSIQINGKSYPLTVKMSAWDKTRKIIPQKIDYYINDRLFKSIRVVKVNFRGIGRRKNLLLKKYKKEFSQAVKVQVQAPEKK